MKIFKPLRQILLLLMLGSISSIFAQPAGWSYKMQIEIYNNSTTNRSNYQELVTINTQSLISSAQMKTGAADMRFGDSCSGNITLFKYYIQSGVNTTATKVWVLVPSVPAKSKTTIWMYYGNSSVSSASDFSSVFSSGLITSGANQTVSGSLNYDYVEVKSGDTLFVDPGKPLKITSRVMVINGAIMANGAGIDSGAVSTNGKGQGKGYISSNGTAGSGGAGYGGSGGQGGYDAGDQQGDSGKVYGTPTGSDINMGSSGASSDLVLGGAGGGQVHLVSAYLELTGSIHADGKPGAGSAARNGGGGSGGGVLLSGASVVFSGIITVRGGNGGVGTASANDDGGGGGGGRIKLFYGSVSGNGTYDVSGGQGGPNGTASGGGDGLKGTFARVASNFSDDSVVVSGILITLSDKDARICPGTPITMTASSGFTKYDFYHNTTNVQSGSSNAYTFTNLSNGDSISVLSVLSSCFSATAKVIVKVDTIPVIVIYTDTAVCRNDTLKLEATGALTYQWKNGPAKALWTLIPKNTDTYEVTGVDGNGCTGSSSVRSKVYDFPVLSSSNDTTMCEKDSITLRVNGSSYVQWSSGLQSKSYRVSPASTTYYPYVAWDVPVCAISDSVKVSINPIPDVYISGRASVCEGGNTTIAANGALSYQWSTGGTGYLLTVSPTVNTRYSVTGTDINGCKDTASRVVVVDTLPVIKFSGDMSLCKGEETVIKVSGALSYIWYNNSKADSLKLKPVSTANYSVIGTDGNSCRDTSSVTVTVNDPPVVSFDLPTALDTVCINDSPWPLSGGLPAGGNYSGRGVSSGNFSSVTAGQGKFELKYVYTDGNNCSDSATAPIVVDACASLTDVKKNGGFQVYPSPTTGMVHVSGPVGVYHVYSVSGKLVSEAIVKDEKLMELGSLPNGLYYITSPDGVSLPIMLNH